MIVVKSTVAGQIIKSFYISRVCEFQIFEVKIYLSLDFLRNFNMNDKNIKYK